MTKLEMLLDAVKWQFTINIMRIKIVAYCVAKAIGCVLVLIKDWIRFQFIFDNADKRREYFDVWADAKCARMTQDMDRFLTKVCQY